MKGRLESYGAREYFEKFYREDKIRLLPFVVPRRRLNSLSFLDYEQVKKISIVFCSDNLNGIILIRKLKSNIAFKRCRIEIYLVTL